MIPSNAERVTIRPQCGSGVGVQKMCFAGIRSYFNSAQQIGSATPKKKIFLATAILRAARHVDSSAESRFASVRPVCGRQAQPHAGTFQRAPRSGVGASPNINSHVSTFCRCPVGAWEVIFGGETQGCAGWRQLTLGCDSAARWAFGSDPAGASPAEIAATGLAPVGR